MVTDFNLSSKAVKDVGCSNPIDDYYWGKDVKEFIRLLRDRINNPTDKDISDMKCGTKLSDFLIDTLAGEDLI